MNQPTTSLNKHFFRPARGRIGIGLGILLLNLAWWLPQAQAQPLDDTWTLTINGQSVQVNPDGSFRIGNIAVPDQFGPGGAGTAPDFIGDDYVRVTGVSTGNGVNRYAYTPYFRVEEGAVHYVTDLIFTNQPLQIPQAIQASVDTTVLTSLGQSLQVRVEGTYADGTTNDLTGPIHGTSYRVSNPAIVNVTSAGIATAVQPGTVFITTVNEGASSVIQVDVLPGEPLTTLIGFVRNPDGTPASGLTVSIPGQGATGVTDVAGNFRIEDVATSLGPISVLVQGMGMFDGFVASVDQLETVPDGFTDAGILVLMPPPPEVFLPLAAGESHVLALKTNGTLWSWGENRNGQIGDGTFTDRDMPDQVGQEADWKSVTAGENHSLALKNNGTLWAWGDNIYGQLGLPSFVGYLTPTQVGTNADWVAIEAGDDHTMALKEDGTVWLTGRNHRGQLGNGTTENQFGFVQLGTGDAWMAIAAGSQHCLALQEDGSLWAWGGNGSAQLGDGGRGGLQSFPVRIGAANDWTQVSAGVDHSHALKLDGSLWSWGSGFYGQSGIPLDEIFVLIPTRVGTDSWDQVVSGATHTLGLRDNGMLWTWGYNYLGQLGQGTMSDAMTNVTPVATHTTWQAMAGGDSFTVALSETGELWSWGANETHQLGRGPKTLQPDPASIGAELDWLTVSAGRWSSAGLKTNGTLWTWGFNFLGELGDGTLTGNPLPRQVGMASNWVQLAGTETHFLAIRDDHTLWGWGLNSDYQIGIGARGDQVIPIQVTTESNWLTCATGHSHSLGIQTNGSLWAWGQNRSGQLGNGFTFGEERRPAQVGTDTDWLSVSAGTSHSLALKTNGTLWAWGNNASGQLGGGTNSFSGRPLPAQVGTDSDWIAVSGGHLYTLALKSNGTVWAWGENSAGQLGNNARSDEYLPQQVGTDTDWVKIDAGDEYAIAIKTDGTVWGWGENGNVQIAEGSMNDQLTPVQISTFTTSDIISAGQDHALLILFNGSLQGWGSNRYGQLGDPAQVLPGQIGTDSNWGNPVTD